MMMSRCLILKTLMRATALLSVPQILCMELLREVRLLHKGGEPAQRLKPLRPQVLQVPGENPGRHQSLQVLAVHHLAKATMILKISSHLMQMTCSHPHQLAEGQAVRAVTHRSKAVPQTHQRHQPVQDEGQEQHRKLLNWAKSLKVIDFIFDTKIHQAFTAWLMIESFP